MTNALQQKLEKIRGNTETKEFILADARDADMAWGAASFGKGWPERADGSYRGLDEFLDEIRAVVQQGAVDILLGSVSVIDRLAHREGLFDKSHVTPAVRANDTSDVWCQRGACYRESRSLPFATTYIHEAQYGSLTAEADGNPKVNLGLYSVTFNNDLESDLRHLEAYRVFRADAERRGFKYFLEVFAPNVDAGIGEQDIPAFVNDQVIRMLAAVPAAGRPEFLKVPYFGPRWMEELASYDPSLVVGIMGGSAGTTLESFQMLADAQRYGARAALFGRRIKDAEEPLSFIAAMRNIVDGKITAEEAVRWYHGELQRKKIASRRSLEDDMTRGSVTADYSSAR